MAEFAGVEVGNLPASHGSNTAEKKSPFFVVKRLRGVNDPQNCKRLHCKTGGLIQILFNRLRNPGRHFK